MKTQEQQTIEEILKERIKIENEKTRNPFRRPNNIQPRLSNWAWENKLEIKETGGGDLSFYDIYIDSVLKYKALRKMYKNNSWLEKMPKLELVKVG